MGRWHLMILPMIVATGFCLAGESEPQTPPEHRPESWEYRGEVFGTLGWGKFWHGDDDRGSGTSVGGGLGWWPFRSRLRGLGMEVELRRLGFRTPKGPYSTDGNTVLAMANVVYHFCNQRVQPFLKGGAGVVRSDYTSHWISDWFDDQGIHHIGPAFEQVRASKFGIDLGAGINAAIGHNFSIRGEVLIVDTTPGEGYNWGVLLLNTGIGYHW